MRIALLADIHSNLHALEAVLRAIDRLQVDEIVCLGDVVGYNAFPRECLHLVARRASHVLLGNHDWAAVQGLTPNFNPLARAGIEHTRKELSKEDMELLRSYAPAAQRDNGGVALEFYHASPLDPLWEYVFPMDAPALFSVIDAARPNPMPRIVSLGHTHLPMLAASGAVNSTSVGDLSQDVLRDNLLPARPPLLLVNPGSVGQPRDADPRAAFAVLDTARFEAAFHRVEYDMEAAADAVQKAGLPPLLASRLLIGR